ncbi:MAG: PAS domain-containing protein [Synergistetes bacterium]|nr:PAS domain-containing protein [Synergistota bacterium]MDW8191681.1 PAS domain-containing protein [Synergistota bacterium]
MIKTSEKDVILKALSGILDDLRMAIGEDCELVLHDLSKPESSVIKVSGNLTGRRVGAPLTDLVLRLLRKGEPIKSILNYRATTPDGRLLKSSTLFIRDGKDNVIGCLCINQDISFWIKVSEALSQKIGSVKEDIETHERFFDSLSSLLSNVVSNVLAKIGVPVSEMGKKQRIEALRMLDQEGVFLVRGAVEYVARRLGISKYTLYSYLKEIKSQLNLEEGGMES